MTHVYLIRHADYIDDLVDGKYPKQDQGLSPEGIQQAGRLRDRLAKTGEIKADVFLASTARRARETAEILVDALVISPSFDEDLEEWRSDDGNMPEDKFMAIWGSLTDAQRPYYRWVEGYETLLEFSLRVHATLNRIFEEHEGKTIVILSHGAYIQVAFAYFFGTNLALPQRAAPEIRHTSISHWFKTPSQRWILERSNDYHHLL